MASAGRLGVFLCLLALCCSPGESRSFPPGKACVLGVAALHAARPRRCEATERRGRKKKSMRLHDIKRDESQGNEYYAGGIDDQGHGSGTVLLYPRDEYANTTASEPEPSVNASAAKDGAESTPFKGAGRSLS